MPSSTLMPPTQSRALPPHGWRLLGAVLRTARWQAAGQTRTGLKTLAEQTGIPMSALSGLETGQNENPKVNVLRRLAANGHIIDPRTGQAYSAAELLAIACGQLQPLNPSTKQPFTYSDFVFLKLAKTEDEIDRQLCLRSQLGTPVRQKTMSNGYESVLPQVIQQWMQAEELDLDSFFTFVEAAIVAFNAIDDVTAAGIVEVAMGRRLPTEAELNFIFVLPLRGSHVLTDLAGQTLDPVNDWIGTLQALDLPLERYTSPLDHRLLNGNGLADF